MPPKTTNPSKTSSNKANSAGSAPKQTGSRSGSGPGAGSGSGQGPARARTTPGPSNPPVPPPAQPAPAPPVQATGPLTPHGQSLALQAAGCMASKASVRTGLKNCIARVKDGPTPPSGIMKKSMAGDISRMLMDVYMMISVIWRMPKGPSRGQDRVMKIVKEASDHAGFHAISLQISSAEDAPKDSQRKEWGKRWLRIVELSEWMLNWVEEHCRSAGAEGVTIDWSKVDLGEMTKNFTELNTELFLAEHDL